MTRLLCRDETRRDTVREAKLNGLDFVEVDPEDRNRLKVWFLGKAPEGGIEPGNVVVEGGRRITGLRVEKVEILRHDDPAEDDCTKVTLDRSGDLSTYRLCLREMDEQGRATETPLGGFDPRYACVEFTFDAGCPSDLDCAAEPPCPPEPLEEPELHYLAKDYASFRQLILDRLSLIMPDWQERHVPDIGITLVELLAYVGDHLSYYQDAVATEAYLDTARERISVRRHARLVDYAMHEGCNARAWVVLETSQAALPLDPEVFWLRAGGDGTSPRMVRAEDLRGEADDALVFEPVVEPGRDEAVLRAARNEIRIHTWGDASCCLPRGATGVDLLDPGTVPQPRGDDDEACEDEQVQQASPRSHPQGGQDHPGQAPYGKGEKDREPRETPVHDLDLKPCDVLMFEEVTGPRTGHPADADPAHRHAVRLTRVEPGRDPLTGQLVWHVEWGREDALPFPVCVSAVGPAPECEPIRDVTVVRGNVILVDHGSTTEEDLDPVPCVPAPPPCCDDCEPAEVRVEPGRYEPILERPRLTHAEPHGACHLPSSCGVERIRSAAASLRQDPRNACPQVIMDGIAAGPECRPLFEHDDLEDPARLARSLTPAATGPARWLRNRLRPQTVRGLDDWLNGGPDTPPSMDLLSDLLSDLSGLVERWEAATHLLDCGPDDRHFVVEMDDERRAHLRFGRGSSGCRPGAGTAFRASYRLGNGSVGNVGAEAIRQIVFRTEFPSGAGIRVRNPKPAVGGTDPESVSEVKAYAPHAFRRVLKRAVTADDYAMITMRDFDSRVQRAAATLRWTGSHQEVLVAIDPRDASTNDETLLCEVERHLGTYRRIGHDVSVTWAHPVPVHLAMTICVLPGHLRGHVKVALLDVFASRRRSDGGFGFFHPDMLSFGEGVQASEIVAAAQAVEGVESVHMDAFERLFEGPNGEIEAGVLPLGPLEVARLDNDPNRPENGRLDLTMSGGR